MFLSVSAALALFGMTACHKAPHANKFHKHHHNRTTDVMDANDSPFANKSVQATASAKTANCQLNNECTLK